MNSLVLSGTAPIVPSGTGSTCYQGPESLEKPRNSDNWGARNFSNKESFGFFLTDRAFFAAEDDRRSAAYGTAISGFPNISAGGETALPSLRSGSAQQVSGGGAIA